MEDMNDFIREQVLNNIIFTSESVSEYDVGTDVLVYGISRFYIPLNEKEAMLVMEDDENFTSKRGAIYVLIDEHNPVHDYVKSGNLMLCNGMKTFIRGTIIDKKICVKNGEKVVSVFIKPED